MKSVLLAATLLLWLGACSLPSTSATVDPRLQPTRTPIPATRMPKTSTPFPLTPTAACEEHDAVLLLDAESERLKVGERLQVSVTLSNAGCGMLGLPEYRLSVLPVEEDARFEPEQLEPVVHYRAINPGEADAATFELQAVRPGEVDLRASASFEVHLGSAGPAYWSMASAPPLRITILP